jgi:L-ribulose-5-phosphate 3-epimerase
MGLDLLYNMLLETYLQFGGYAMTDESRRTFLTKSLIAGAGFSAIPSLLSNTATAYPRPTVNKISLATWSINRSFRMGGWKMDDLPRIVREDFGLDGIEHVNQFFDVPHSTNLTRWNKLASDHGVENVLIMIDHEGSLVAKDKNERKQAVVNHRKWIDIAAFMGCHAVRCNAHGGGKTPQEDPDALQRAGESFSELIEYAKDANINVIIENHGGSSSFPGWLPSLCKELDNPHFGLLPDFGNYTQDTDVYSEVKNSLPYAKGISVKTAWNEAGEQLLFDLPRLLKICKDFGYTGYWGIESGYRFSSNPKSLEEAKQGEWQAVKWTKQAIEKHIF